MRKPIQYVSYGAKPFGWEWIWTIQALQPTLLNVALRFFPFSQAWYTIARGWLVYITIWFKSFTSSPIFILISSSIISQFLNPIVSSLSLSLSSHYQAHRKIQNFFQYIQVTFHVWTEPFITWFFNRSISFFAIVWTVMISYFRKKITSTKTTYFRFYYKY